MSEPPGPRRALRCGPARCWVECPGAGRSRQAVLSGNRWYQRPRSGARRRPRRPRRERDLAHSRGTRGAGAGGARAAHGGTAMRRCGNARRPPVRRRRARRPATSTAGIVDCRVQACRAMRHAHAQRPDGGAPGRNRTCGLPLRRRLLYPLSYGGGVRWSGYAQHGCAERSALLAAIGQATNDRGAATTGMRGPDHIESLRDRFTLHLAATRDRGPCGSVTLRGLRNPGQPPGGATGSYPRPAITSAKCSAPSLDGCPGSSTVQALGIGWSKAGPLNAAR